MATDVSARKTGEDLLVATFQLGEGTFGIDTALIQEVVMTGDLTPVHHAPDYVAGVRNLRGRIITVIDLRVRLDLGCVARDAESRILIVDWKSEPVGVLVDRVADTVPVGADALQVPPPNLHGVQMQNLLGVFRSGERLAALLDPVPVLDPDYRTGPPLQQEGMRDEHTGSGSR
jgi:purine-binding chemotaxis protein CheW